MVELTGSKLRASSNFGCWGFKQGGKRKISRLFGLSRDFKHDLKTRFRVELVLNLILLPSFSFEGLIPLKLDMHTRRKRVYLCVSPFSARPATTSMFYVHYNKQYCDLQYVTKASTHEKFSKNGSVEKH